MATTSGTVTAIATTTANQSRYAAASASATTSVGNNELVTTRVEILTTGQQYYLRKLIYETQDNECEVATNYVYTYESF